MKKILALLLALIMMLALVACGGNGDTVDTPGGQPTAELSVDELLNLGQQYLSDYEFEKAIDTFASVIEIDLRNVEALIGRGTALILWQEDIPAARSDFELVLEIDESNEDAGLGLVDIYIRLGEFDRALEIARQSYDVAGGELLRDKVQMLESDTVLDSEGRVRRVRHYDGDGLLLFFLVNTYAQGLQTATTTFDPAGNVIDHGYIIRDDRGNILQSHLTRIYGPYAGRLTIRENTFNSAGQLIRRDSVSPSGATSFTLYEYREDGVLYRRTSYSSDGSMTHYTIFDSRGLRERTNHINYYGQLEAYEIYEYDFEGRMIRRSFYHSDGTLLHYHVNEYDETSRLLSRTFYAADGTVEYRIVHD